MPERPLTVTAAYIKPDGELIYHQMILDRVENDEYILQNTLFSNEISSSQNLPRLRISRKKRYFTTQDRIARFYDHNERDYVFKTARYLGINIEESYTLPNELHKYSVYDANNNLQNTDSLTKHYRIVQMRDIDMIQLSTLSTFLRETVPASVEVEISKHDSEVHNRRYVKRVDIEAAQKELELLKMIK